MQLWVVARKNSVEEIADHQGHTWDLIGVCSDEQKAIDACEDDQYYIGPIQLDQILPKEMVKWEGAYYPKRGK